MSKLLKRLERAEARVEAEIQEAKEAMYIDVVAIRLDSDLEKYKGKIGPNTRVIKIVAAKERVHPLDF